MYYVQDAHSFWDFIYFVLLIIVSRILLSIAIFIIACFVAIICCYLAARVHFSALQS